MPARSKSGSAKATSQVVKYTGPYDEKTISEDEWKSIEIDDQKGVVWNWRNDWAIPVEQFSESALNYCKNRDPNLKIINAEASD